MTDILQQDADDQWERVGRLAGKHLVDTPTRPTPLRGDATRFGAVRGLPEVHREELDAQVVADGLVSRGSLVVRSFLSTDAVETVRADYWDKNHGSALSMDETRDDGANAQATMEASWVPAPAFKHIVDYCRSIGYLKLLSALFGEQPVLQRERVSVAERTSRVPGLPWHQDAAYYGREVIGLNAWIALTPAGADWPGLDICPCRLDRVIGLTDVESELRDSPAPHTYALGEASFEVDRVLADAPPVSLQLAPGDALLFDTLTLHRTPIARTPAVRENATLWAFAPSAFPAWGTPFSVGDPHA